MFNGAHGMTDLEDNIKMKKSSEIVLAKLNRCGINKKKPLKELSSFELDCP